MKKTICLVMIVRNESKVIERCLNRVKDHIDYWVIVDTGSDDNTPELIKQTLKNVPGELHHRTWINFGVNRTESLQLAKGKADYLLLCDADEQIIFSDDFDASQLSKDSYMIQYTGGNTYFTDTLISGKIDWKYVGVTHEYLDSDQHYTSGKLSTIKILDLQDGGFKAHKYERDISLLEQGLIDEPDNSRYKFYLANSYRDINNFEKAAEWYKKRIADGGWKEEVTVSYENLGACYDFLQKPQEALHYWLMGYDYNPKRLECLFNAIRLLRKQKKYQLAYQLCLIGKNIPFPKDDILFIKNRVYSYLLYYELSLCSYHTQDFKSGYESSKHVLLQEPENDGIIVTVFNNLYFYKEEAEKDTRYNIKSLLAVLEGFLSRHPEYKENVGYKETLKYLNRLIN